MTEFYSLMVEIFLYKVSSEGNTINVRPSCSDRKIKLRLVDLPTLSISGAH